MHNKRISATDNKHFFVSPKHILNHRNVFVVKRSYAIKARNRKQTHFGIYSERKCLSKTSLL